MISVTNAPPTSPTNPDELPKTGFKIMGAISPKPPPNIVPNPEPEIARPLNQSKYRASHRYRSICPNISPRCQSTGYRSRCTPPVIPTFILIPRFTQVIPLIRTISDLAYCRSRHNFPYRCRWPQIPGSCYQYAVKVTVNNSFRDICAFR